MSLFEPLDAALVFCGPPTLRELNLTCCDDLTSAALARQAGQPKLESLVIRLADVSAVAIRAALHYSNSMGSSSC
jgi:hypothetical protein